MRPLNFPVRFANPSKPNYQPSSCLELKKKGGDLTKTGVSRGDVCFRPRGVSLRAEKCAPISQDNSLGLS